MPAVQGVPEDLDRLVPFNPLLRQRVRQMLPHARIRQLPPGSYLFHAGDDDGLSHFLLSGQILLYEGRGSRPVPLRAIDRDASQPIAPGVPRRVHALAATTVSILSIETRRLEQLGGGEGLIPPVRPAMDTNLWGIDQRRGRARAGQGQEDRLRELPSTLVESLPDSLRSLLGNRLCHEEVTAGTEIVTQGDPGEYYYFIARGRCRLTRRRGAKGDRQAIVAIRQRGQSFGAEALIDGGPQRCTVTALQDTILLRLGRAEFMSLLVRPFLNSQTLDQALDALRRDDGRLLDIRSPRVFQQGHIPQSINLPLSLLSQSAPLLDPRHHYTICCESTRRGMMAAFLLAEQGIRSSILEGGVRRHCDTRSGLLAQE